jgi:uncharacterized protein YggU (UPF0235/DUF167 family)
VEPGLPWRAIEGALLVTIRLTPRGGRDALGGIETLAGGRAVLTARVRAAPTEGEANAALVKLLAKSLRIPASQIRFVQGETARIKTLQLSGDGEYLAGRLSALLAGES